MAITTSKPEIFSPGATDISWRSLPTNIGGQGVQNIRFGVYKRVISPNDENPLVPDAEENSQIGTDESGNLSIGAFRGAIKRHDITIGAGEYQNLNFTNYFGNNIVKNIVKKISIGGTIYSDDVDLPAAEIIISQPNEEIINLEVEVTSSGAIYGSGAPGDTDEGITGGTALYVQAPGSRNFTIDIDSGGKIYGGGGGGIQGNPGTSNTINTCSQTNSVTYPGNTEYYNYTAPGNPGPINRHREYIGDGFTQARMHDENAEAYCRSRHRGNSFGGSATGIRDTPARSGRDGAPNYISGNFDWYCNSVNAPNAETIATTNPPYTITNTINDSVTSAGGPGGTGGIGQGYQRSFSIGVGGTKGPTVACSSLGPGWSGPSAAGNPGNPGTSGGNWGEPGTPNDAGIEGGNAGFAIKTDGSISYEVIGADDNRLKGQTSPTI